ncbi:MOSC domain-containing protein [Methylomonas sp. MgM2]
MPALSQIYLYPIKSVSGIQVQRWPVNKNGLVYDRKWMLIDKEHRFLSQRRLPKMALIKTRIEQDQLIVAAPGMPDLNLDIKPVGNADIEVEIWRDHCLAKTISEQADIWFSTFLQTECKLVFHPDETQRQVDQRYAKPSDQTAFSDGFPFLIVSQSSLAALNQALPHPVGIDRFRPNLVVDDCEAYAEDSWRRILIKNIEFRLPKPCSRCAIPGIDPETAISAKEPLATLNRLRRWENQIYFGQNALHGHGGELAVGDAVEILEFGPRQPPIA